MQQGTLFADPDPAQLGLTCRGCGAVEARTVWERRIDGVLLIRMDCAACGRFIRHLDPDTDAFRFEPHRPGAHAEELQAPSGGWQWIGLIRQADRVWKAVALTPSLGSCWDALLTYPGEGDRLCIPTRPVQHLEKTR